MELGNIPKVARAYDISVSDDDEGEVALLGDTIVDTPRGMLQYLSTWWTGLVFCVSVIGIAIVIFVLVIQSRPGLRHPFQQQAAIQMPRCPACTKHVNAKLTFLGTFVKKIKGTSHYNGDVSGAEYLRNSARHSGKRVLLRNSDLENGTLRITTPAYIFLTEDIIFDPNSLPTSAAPGTRFPDPVTQPLYALDAYMLGFFAAITVEAPNVVIDLNGHTIKTGRHFDLLQRFFALIELADRPFPNGAGPANFGTDTIATASGVAIINGRLGRTSHYGIHGNGAHNVAIDNVRVYDFEVAGVACNGCTDVFVHNSHIGPSRSDVPVTGSFSAAVFLHKFANQALTLHGAVAFTTELARLQAAIGPLTTLIAETVGDIAHDGMSTVDDITHTNTARLVGNPSGLPDGAAFGLVFHKKGIAVDGFVSGESDHIPSKDIVIHKTTVTGIRAAPKQIITLIQHPSGDPVTGPSGEVFDITLSHNRVSGLYVPNAISDVQIALAALVDALPSTEAGAFGSLRIPRPVQAWALAGNTSLATIVQSGAFGFARNADIMFHVHKGVIGIRIDGVRDACLEDVVVHGVNNVADRPSIAPQAGETAHDVGYEGSTDGGHPQQGRQRGYMGLDTRGISLSAAVNVHGSGTHVRDVTSRYGWSHAYDAFNHAQSVCFDNPVAEHVTSMLPNPSSQSCATCGCGQKVARSIGYASESSTKAIGWRSPKSIGIDTGYNGISADEMVGYKP